MNFIRNFGPGDFRISEPNQKHNCCVWRRLKIIKLCHPRAPFAIFWVDRLQKTGFRSKSNTCNSQRFTKMVFISNRTSQVAGMRCPTPNHFSPTQNVVRPLVAQGQLTRDSWTYENSREDNKFRFLDMHQCGPLGPMPDLLPSNVCDVCEKDCLRSVKSSICCPDISHPDTSVFKCSTEQRKAAEEMAKRTL